MSIRAEKKAISVVKKSVLNGINALDLVFSEGILQLVCRGGVSGRGVWGRMPVSGVQQSISPQDKRPQESRL